MQGNHLGSIQDGLDKVSVDYDVVDQQDKLKHDLPLLEYEESRRRLRNDIQEMW